MEPWLSTEEPMTPIGPPTADNQAWKVRDLIFPETKD